MLPNEVCFLKKNEVGVFPKEERIHFMGANTILAVGSLSFHRGLFLKETVKFFLMRITPVLTRIIHIGKMFSISKVSFNLK